MKTTSIALSAATLLSTAAGRQFVQYASGSNNGDDTLIERSDPILNPGAPAGHVHSIFGANGFSPSASYDSLQQSDCTTVGASDGSGNAQDKSSYWHPTLYMEAKNGTGYIKVPTSTHKIYYRDFGSTNDKVIDPFEFPQGFRMIAGDAALRAPNSNEKWQGITQWMCHAKAGDSTGADGGFPADVSDCDNYPGFNGAIDFPHCWNGEDFNQSDPYAHVSYATGDPVHGDCPDSHPTRLPHIFMENEFNIHAVIDQVKPNSFVLSQGDPTGFGWHVDFFNGWDAGAIPELFRSCPAPYYGNEDIGTCPSYKRFDTAQKDCKLKQTYTENVDAPGQMLPGCNPVTRTNPAPKLAVAAIGVVEDVCAAAGALTGGAASSSSDSMPASSSSYPSSSSSRSSPSSSSSSSPTSEAAAATSSPLSTHAPHDASTSASPTTPIMSAAATLAQHDHPGNSPAAAVDHASGDEDVVYVTEIVTITVTPPPAAAPTERSIKARRDHAQHLAVHKRHAAS